MGILAVVDRERIASCCFWWGRFMILRRDVEKEGNTTDKGGSNPKVKQMHEAYREFAREATILGLGPAARASIKVDKKPAADSPGAKYFRNG
jgi:phage terminase small subunit